MLESGAFSLARRLYERACSKSFAVALLLVAGCSSSELVAVTGKSEDPKFAFEIDLPRAYEACGTAPDCYSAAAGSKQRWRVLIGEANLRFNRGEPIAGVSDARVEGSLG